MKNKNDNNPAFGLHLMVEAYNCPKQTLDDANLAYQILDVLPELMGMHKLIKPYVVQAADNGKRDPGGWSGFVIIQESHISLHTFVKRGFVTADVYSCKHFDVDIALKYLKKMFKTKNIEYDVIVRGTKYPAKNIHS